MSIVFLGNNSNNEIIITMGNNAPNPIPLFRSFSQICKAAKEINHGPDIQPTSPVSANRPNILFPPPGKVLDAKLNVPGHIILIQSPVNAQKISET